MIGTNPPGDAEGSEGSDVGGVAGEFDGGERPPRGHPDRELEKPEHVLVGEFRGGEEVRLSTVAGFYRYCVEEQLILVFPAVHVRRPRLDYESNATGLDRNELGMLLVQAGLAGGRDHALACLLALNGPDQ